MAGSKSDYLENKQLDHTLRNTAYTSPTTVYAALFTVSPSDGGGGTEVSTSGTAYARQAITFGAASGGSISNSVAVNFPTATASYGAPVVAVGVFDASSGGNLLYWSNVAAATKSCTGAASTNLVTATAHGWSATQQVRFTERLGVVLPAGLSLNTTYYIIASGLTANDFKVSATEGGSEVDITADGGAWVAPWSEKTIGINDQYVIAIGALTITED